MGKELEQFALIAKLLKVRIVQEENIAVENALNLDKETTRNVLCVKWSFGIKRKLNFVHEVVRQNQDHHRCWVKNSRKNIEKKLAIVLEVVKIGIGKVELHHIKNKNAENLNILHGVKQFLREIITLVKYVLNEVINYKPITLKVGLNIQNLEQS